MQNLKYLGRDARSKELNEQWFKIFSAPMPIITIEPEHKNGNAYFDFDNLTNHISHIAHIRHNKEAETDFANWEDSDKSLEEIILKHYGQKALEIIFELCDYSL